MTRRKADPSLSRRDFLARSAAGAAALALPPALLPSGSSFASTHPIPSRILINFHGRGGMSQHLGATGVRSTELTGLPSSQWTPLPFFDNPIAHPTADAWLGPAMSMFRRPQLERIAIWRGIRMLAGHDVGNRMLNVGGFSAYLPSFSSLIARRIAEVLGRSLDLHYVQLGENPNVHFTSSAQLLGPAIAVNIPDEAAFRALTAPGAGDLSEPRQGLLTWLMNQLSWEIQGRCQLRRSALLHEDLRNAFLGAVSLQGRNLAASPVYLAIKQAYVTAMLETLASHELVSHFDRVRVFSGPARAELASLTPAWRDRVLFHAYQFAMSEFLTTEGYSAVVDARFFPGDHHDFFDEEMVGRLLFMTGFQQLVSRLSVKTVPGTSEKFIDRALITGITEHDRSPVLSVGNPANSSRPGTDHWNFLTVMLAGCGVRGGRVIGDIKTGNSRGRYGTGRYGNRFVNVPPAHGLPIDPMTGEVDPDGIMPSQLALLPTILKAFGMEPLEPGPEGPVMAVIDPKPIG